jgi:hypothetical protein
MSSFHKLLFMDLDCRVLARLPVALLLEKYGKAAVWFDLRFFGQRPAFFGKSLENHSRLPGRRRNSPSALRVACMGEQ